MSKVSIVKCDSYERRKIADAVSRAVELVGGIGRFVKPGAEILIKPNLLSARKPDEGVCTHPEFVRAVIKLVKDAGGRAVVGDSPGSFFTTKNIDYVYEETGIKSVVEEEGAELVRFEKSRIINGYPVAEAALNASAVISLPKLKTHVLTVMTGAVKNTFGMIPGFHKVECHRRHPKPRDFVKTILDIFEIRKPALSIMDGVVGMDGDGPASGNLKKIGLVIASPDAVSLDAVVSELVGLPSDKDIIVSEARKRMAGEADIHNIELTGEKIEDVRVKNFRLPKTAYGINLLPDFLTDVFTSLVSLRPHIDEKICKKCGICRNSCPVSAITIDEKVSCIDDKICIRCFCCHEVCPYRAIFLKMNFVTRLLWRDEGIKQGAGSVRSDRGRNVRGSAATDWAQPKRSFPEGDKDTKSQDTRTQDTRTQDTRTQEYK